MGARCLTTFVATLVTIITIIRIMGLCSLTFHTGHKVSIITNRSYARVINNW